MVEAASGPQGLPPGNRPGAGAEWSATRPTPLRKQQQPTSSPSASTPQRPSNASMATPHPTVVELRRRVSEGEHPAALAAVTPDTFLALMRDGFAVVDGVRRGDGQGSGEEYGQGCLWKGAC